MSERTLNIGQVASLLVSTSCGIGFLLGTGELALHEGMAGCLYAIASALGLTVLAVCAPALWSGQQSIWGRFDQLYGASISRSVALLSLVWMTGVLAAQIRGGSAILTLTGLSPTSALLLTDGLLFNLSLMRLPWLAAVFAICMLGCNVILVRSLVETAGLSIWRHAPVQFMEAFRPDTLGHAGFTVVSVVVMVICGADYQQFLVAARAPATARAGCLLAAGLVFAIGFLPASAVVAASSLWHLDHIVDPLQVVPVVLMHTLASCANKATGGLIIALLMTTALGAGCPILRAMSDATASLSSRSITRPTWSRILPVVLGSLVATRGQSLVDMMIDLNMVRIAAVGPLLIFGLLPTPVSNTTANAAMATGCSIATTCYLIRWMGITAMPEAAPLLFALPASLAVGVVMSHRSKPFGLGDQTGHHLPPCWPKGSSSGQSATSPSPSPPDDASDD